VSLNSK